MTNRYCNQGSTFQQTAKLKKKNFLIHFVSCTVSTAGLLELEVQKRKNLEHIHYVYIGI